MQKVRAAFLDRDGVINSYLPQRYVETPDQLVILPGVARAIRRFNDAGILTIVISNQQGVARNIMTPSALDLVTETMKYRLAAESDARLDAVYYCTHARDAGCSCRKPKPGMIIEALERFHIDPCDTIFVGDTETDLQAARAARVGVVCLVLSGATHYFDAAKYGENPNRVFCDLDSVANWVLEERD